MWRGNNKNDWIDKSYFGYKYFLFIKKKKQRGPWTKKED